VVQGEGQLLSRAKQEGDSVAASEMLCEVATDKVNMEVESPFSGTLTKGVRQ
jgi:pyruvate dehydrogenase E2 component (dihydrolipoamide acetyltransferase)